MSYNLFIYIAVNHMSYLFYKGKNPFTSQWIKENTKMFKILLHVYNFTIQMH